MANGGLAGLAIVSIVAHLVKVKPVIGLGSYDVPPPQTELHTIGTTIETTGARLADDYHVGLGVPSYVSETTNCVGLSTMDLESATLVFKSTLAAKGCWRPNCSGQVEVPKDSALETSTHRPLAVPFCG